MVAIYNATGIKGVIATPETTTTTGAKSAGGGAFGDLVKGTYNDLKGAGELLGQTNTDFAASKISEMELMQNLTEAQLNIDRITTITRVGLEAVKKTVETPL